jgi:hypothetical protein
MTNRLPRRNYAREGAIERIDHMREKYGWHLGEQKPVEKPTCFEGVKQTFAMYVHQRIPPYGFGYPMVELTRVGGLVSLESFYDFGRIPVTIGWGNGRVMWTGEKGSKWLNFKTWGDFRWRVFLRDNGTCKKCGKILATQDENGRWPYQPEYVCDHVVPLFKGGKDWHEDPEMSNFQTLCVDCNKIKTRYDVAKPKVIKQRLGLKTMQYAGFVFEQTIPENHTLMQFISEKIKK